MAQLQLVPADELPPEPQKKGRGKGRAAGAAKPTNGGISELMKQLWQAAVELRGSIEPPDYKRYVLPLIFLRFLSLRYERRRVELERLIADPASEYYTTDPRVAADIPVSYQQGAGAPFAITGILQNDSEEERRQDGVYARLSANLATSSRLRNSE